MRCLKTMTLNQTKMSRFHECQVIQARSQKTTLSKTKRTTMRRRVEMNRRSHLNKCKRISNKTRVSIRNLPLCKKLKKQMQKFLPNQLIPKAAAVATSAIFSDYCFPEKKKC